MNVYARYNPARETGATTMRLLHRRRRIRGRKGKIILLYIPLRVFHACTALFFLARGVALAGWLRRVEGGCNRWVVVCAGALVSWKCRKHNAMRGPRIFTPVKSRTRLVDDEIFFSPSSFSFWYICAIHNIQRFFGTFIIYEEHTPPARNLISALTYFRNFPNQRTCFWPLMDSLQLPSSSILLLLWPQDIW